MQRFLAAAALLATSVTGATQSYVQTRVMDMADQLKRASVRLAERAVQDVVRNYTNTRSDLDQALLAQQIDGSATLLAEMARMRRPVNELRDVANELMTLSRRAPISVSNSPTWRPVLQAITDINRELNNSGPPPSGPPPRPVIGRVAWRGTVDDRVQLVIRGRSLDVRTVTGAPQTDGTATFTSALPAGDVEVDVTKTSGRGSVRVLQQPSRANDYTAVIEIFDESGGAREYRLDIFWMARR